MMVGLVVAGVTAFPLTHEVRWLSSVLNNPHTPFVAHMPWLTSWIATGHDRHQITSAKYPFIAYGTDWLAYAHLMIALAFIGPFRDPVRNVWVVQWAMIACLSIIPLALIAGPGAAHPVLVVVHRHVVRRVRPGAAAVPAPLSSSGSRRWTPPLRPSPWRWSVPPADGIVCSYRAVCRGGRRCARRRIVGRGGAGLGRARCLRRDGFSRPPPSPSPTAVEDTEAAAGSNAFTDLNVAGVPATRAVRRHARGSRADRPRRRGRGGHARRQPLVELHRRLGIRHRDLECYGNPLHPATPTMQWDVDGGPWQPVLKPVWYPSNGAVYGNWYSSDMPAPVIPAHGSRVFRLRVTFPASANYGVYNGALVFTAPPDAGIATRSTGWTSVTASTPSSRRRTEHDTSAADTAEYGASRFTVPTVTPSPVEPSVAEPASSLDGSDAERRPRRPFVRRRHHPSGRRYRRRTLHRVRGRTVLPLAASADRLGPFCRSRRAGHGCRSAMIGRTRPSRTVVTRSCR